MRVRSLAFMMIAFFVIGCPSTTPTAVTITRVTVAGDPESNDFDLQVEGNGFGPTSITYDLSSQTGRAVADLRLEIINSVEAVRITIPRANLSIPSPKLIIADVRDHPLPVGLYGINLYLGDANEPIATGVEMFRVDGKGYDGGVGRDADVDPTRDATNDDATENPNADAEADGGTPDVEEPIFPDAEPTDLGPPDTGVPPDSGLGEFVGNYLYRQEVLVTNNSAADAPLGTTVLVTIPHATFVALGRSRMDAADVALYYGTVRIDHQWDDEFLIGRDDLTMVARIPENFPVGTFAGPTRLVLYYGDLMGMPVARTDNVYEFVQRFDTDVIPLGYRSNMWFFCTYNRPLEVTTTEGAFCIQDDNEDPTRRTLASPNVATIRNNLAANQIYEMSLWTSGRMTNPAADMMYFAYGPNQTDLVNTTVLPAAAYTGFAPNVAITFQETNGNNRNVPGWQYSTAAFEWWKRSRGRFVSGVDQPSLHLRFISADNDDNAATAVIADDWTIRVALEPELSAVLGPVELR